MTNCIFKVHFELHQDEAKCHLLPRHAILSVSVRPSTAGGRMERLHSSNSHWEQQQRSSYRARHLDLRDIPVIENGELKKGSVNLLGLYCGCQSECSQLGCCY